MTTELHDNNASGQPLGLGSSEGLGPLPEPRDLDGARWGYDADDMHNYAVDAYAAGVAAERERCAALCLRPAGWLTTQQQAIATEIRAAILGNAGRL